MISISQESFSNSLKLVRKNNQNDHFQTPRVLTKRNCVKKKLFNFKRQESIYLLGYKNDLLEKLIFEIIVLSKNNHSKHMSFFNSWLPRWLKWSVILTYFNLGWEWMKDNLAKRSLLHLRSTFYVLISVNI